VKPLSLPNADNLLMKTLPGINANEPSPFNFFHVKNIDGMKKFIAGFSEGYFGHTPGRTDNPIAQSYCAALFNAFQDKKSKLDYFYVLDDTRHLAAVSAIGIVKSYCYSYCIAVAPESRGKKISTHLLNHHAHYAKQADCRFLVLQTEADSFVEHLYVRNGYVRFATLNYYQYKKP